jgi:hypothetical protein
MKKEYIIGGLALLGVIGVISYLKKPKRNSEGFFGANGINSTKTNIFGNPLSGVPVFPTMPLDTCNLPNTFVRKVFTDRGMKNYCGRYDRTLTNKGFVYRLQLNIPNATFVNGNFINSAGSVIVTNSPKIINASEFETAFLRGQLCTITPPSS